MFPAIARLAALALFTSAVPCAAVGLGPLEKSGVTDGPAKAFYLSLANPYSTAERFVAEAVGPDDDAPQPRVLVFPSDTILGAGAPAAARHRQGPGARRAVWIPAVRDARASPSGDIACAGLFEACCSPSR